MHILPAYALLFFFVWRASRSNTSVDDHIEVLSVEYVRERLAKKNPPLLIDVRSKKRNQETLKNSISIPLETIKTSMQQFAKKDTPLILYCRDGSKSYQAAKLLYHLGYTHITDMVGGLITWQDAGYPTIRRDDILH